MKTEAKVSAKSNRAIGQWLFIWIFEDKKSGGKNDSLHQISYELNPKKQ